MRSRWTTERTVTLPARQFYHCLEAYRWDRLALYLDVGRQVPGYIEDEEIDNTINEAWKNRHWLCDR